MLINVIDIPITGKEFTQKLSHKDLDLELTLLEHVAVKGKMLKTGNDVFITGKLTACVEASCHRCLENFSLPINTEFELFYQPFPSNQDDDVLEIAPEELGVLHYQDTTIDLTPAIRDTIILEIPMKLLCSELCKGLCSKCGTNLNRETCGCHREKEGYNPFKEFFQKSKT